jgi:hypothetical protein
VWVLQHLSSSVIIQNSAKTACLKSVVWDKSIKSCYHSHHVLANSELLKFVECVVVSLHRIYSMHNCVPSYWNSGFSFTIFTVSNDII